MRKDRLICNREIVKILAETIELYPDSRFGQLLLSSNIVRATKQGPNDFSDPTWQDEFYTESNELLNRLKG